MKNWQETRQICTRLEALKAESRTAALAVIVGIKGSTYRRPGAKLLVEEDGSMLGNVSGGCVENDIREAALEAIRSSRPALKHYDTSDEEDTLWGLGLGCNGEVDVLILPLGPGEAFASCLHPLLEGREEIDVGYTFSERGATVSLNAGQPILAVGEPGEDARSFRETLAPPPDLVVVGGGDDALPLVDIAHRVGFRVHVVDHRSAYADPARFPAARCLHRRAEQGLGPLPSGPSAFVILKTHATVHDRAWLEVFLETEIPYIGLLGPRARRDELLESVGPAGRARVYGPVGLDIGGDGPEQVALSAVAEVLAVYTGRNAGHLRDREEPIH